MKKTKLELSALILPVGAAVFCLLLTAVFVLIGGGALFSEKFWRVFKLVFLFLGGSSIPLAILLMTWTDDSQSPWEYAMGIYYGGAALGYVIGELTHDRSMWSIGLGWVIAVVVAVIIYEKIKQHNSRW